MIWWKIFYCNEVVITGDEVTVGEEAMARNYPSQVRNNEEPHYNTKIDMYAEYSARLYDYKAIEIN